MYKGYKVNIKSKSKGRTPAEVGSVFVKPHTRILTKTVQLVFVGPTKRYPYQWAFDDGKAVKICQGLWAQ